jgi:hypothetical protein
MKEKEITIKCPNREDLDLCHLIVNLEKICEEDYKMTKEKYKG